MAENSTVRFADQTERRNRKDQLVERWSRSNEPPDCGGKHVQIHRRREIRHRSHSQMAGVHQNENVGGNRRHGVQSSLLSPSVVQTERCHRSRVSSIVRPRDHCFIANYCSSPPFQISRRGWGEFPIRVQLYFHERINQKPLQIYHNLILDKKMTGLQTMGE